MLRFNVILGIAFRQVHQYFIPTRWSIASCTCSDEPFKATRLATWWRSGQSWSWPEEDLPGFRQKSDRPSSHPFFKNETFLFCFWNLKIFVAFLASMAGSVKVKIHFVFLNASHVMTLLLVRTQLLWNDSVRGGIRTPDVWSEEDKSSHSTMTC